MVTCSKCSRPQGAGISQFFFPKDPQILKLWIDFVSVPGKAFVPHKNSRMCHLHFQENCFTTMILSNGKTRRVLKERSVPDKQSPNPVIVRQRSKFATPLGQVVRKRLPMSDITNLSSNISSSESPEISHEVKRMTTVSSHGTLKQKDAVKGQLSVTPRSVINDVSKEIIIEFPSNQESSHSRVKSVSQLTSQRELENGVWSTKVSIETRKKKKKKGWLELPADSTRNKIITCQLKQFVSVPGQRRGVENGLPERSLDDQSTKVQVLQEFHTTTEAVMWEELGLKSLTHAERAGKLLRIAAAEKDAKEKVLAGLSSFQEPDQIDRMIRGNMKTNTRPWGNTTIASSLVIKSRCGTTGYNGLIDAGFPMPSVRSLQRSIEHIKFKPGIQQDLLKAAATKLKAAVGTERDPKGLGLYGWFSCDEMSFRKGIEYDSSLRQNIGFVSPTFSKLSSKECETTPASKLLLVELRGVALHWKQIIAYDFMGSKDNSSAKFKSFKDSLTSQAEKEGFIILGWSTDMASDNVAVWGLEGVFCNRLTDNVLAVHPVDPARRMVTMPDPPHAFKNVNYASIKYDVDVSSARWFFETNGLTHLLENKETNYTVKVKEHLLQLLKIQEKSNVVLVPGLHKSHILPSSNWQKMRVDHTLKIINDKVVMALITLVGEKCLDESALVTAAYLRLLWMSYRIMSGRKRWLNSLELTESDLEIPDFDEDEPMPLIQLPRTGAERVQILELTIKLMRDMKFVGARSSWLPSQTAITMCARGILETMKMTVLNPACPISYLLPSRLTTEGCENQFSSVRDKTGERNPGAKKAKEQLRSDAVTQCIKPARGASYHDTLDTTILSPEDVPAPLDVEEGQGVQIDYTPFESVLVKEVSKFEKYGVYHISGFVARKAMVKKDVHNCAFCHNALMLEEAPNDEKFATFTKHLNRGVRPNTGLKFPTMNLFSSMEIAEVFFNVMHVQCKTMKEPAKALAKVFLDHELCKSTLHFLPPCHQELISIRLLEAYFLTRFNSELAKDRQLVKDQLQTDYAGKTAMMTTSANVSNRRPAKRKGKTSTNGKSGAKIAKTSATGTPPARNIVLYLAAKPQTVQLKLPVSNTWPPEIVDLCHDEISDEDLLSVVL